MRISHKEGTCTRRSCAARRACSCGLVIPLRGCGFLGLVSVGLFLGPSVVSSLPPVRALGVFFVGLCFWVGACSALSAPSHGWLVVGRSSWSACSAVPLLCCLLACGLLCVLLAALVRAVALVLCGPWAVVFPGLLAVLPLGSFVGACFWGFPEMLDARSKIRAPQLGFGSHCRMDFAVPRCDALISQLLLLKSAICRYSFAFEKLAYSTIRSTICLVFSGSISLPNRSLPLPVWSPPLKLFSVLIRSMRTLSRHSVARTSSPDRSSAHLTQMWRDFRRRRKKHLASTSMLNKVRSCTRRKWPRSSQHGRKDVFSPTQGETGRSNQSTP